MNQINNNEMEGRALRPANRSAMSKYAKAEHKRAAKALGYGLTLGDDSAWFSVSAVWQARLARTMGAGDENTARDMGAFVRSVDHLRNATGAHVMVIHHSGKDASKGARGSGSLRAAVDAEIHLSRSGAVVMAETRKQRDMPTGSVFAYLLRDVEIGTDEDGEPVTSAVVEMTEPVAKRPQLSAQQRIALQALDDAIVVKGEKRLGDMYPQNRRCVSLATWREYCNRHSLSNGESESAKRKAFFAVKTKLHEKEVMRIVDEYVWKCDE